MSWMLSGPSFSGNCGLIDCYAAADVRKLIECLRKCHPHITYFLYGLVSMKNLVIYKTKEISILMIISGII